MKEETVSQSRPSFFPAKPQSPILFAVASAAQLLIALSWRTIFVRIAVKHRLRQQFTLAMHAQCHHNL